MDYEIQEIIDHAIAYAKGQPTEWQDAICLILMAPQLLEMCEAVVKEGCNITLCTFDQCCDAVAEAKGNHDHTRS